MRRIDPRLVVVSQQCVALADGLRRSVPWAAGLALLGAFTLVNIARATTIAAFVALLALVLGLKLLLARGHRSALSRESYNPYLWRAGFRSVAAAHGMVWGLSVWTLFPTAEYSGPVALSVALAVTYVAVEAPIFAAIDWVAGAAVLLPSLAPLIGRLFAESGETHYLMIYLVGFFIAASFRSRWLQVIREQRGRETSLALRPSEEFLDRLGDMARLGAWELEVPSGTLWLTRRAYQIGGIDPSTPLTIDVALRAFPEEYRPRLKAGS